MNEGPVIPFLSRTEKTCATCHHFRQSSQKVYAFAATPAGYVLTPVDDLKKENRMPENAASYLMSFCTATPQWAQVPDTHYCGQWKTAHLTPFKEL